MLVYKYSSTNELYTPFLARNFSRPFFAFSSLLLFLPFLPVLRFFSISLLKYPEVSKKMLQGATSRDPSLVSTRPHKDRTAQQKPS